ncbi:MAG: TMEM143 family protein [Micropepsaceae bacterium]
MTAESHTAENSVEPSAAAKLHFIPVLRADLIAAMRDQGLANDQVSDFQTLATFLGAYFHHDFYDELTELKDTYAWFSPTGPHPVRRETRDADAAFGKLMVTFESVMSRANFVELPKEQVEALGGDHPHLDVKTRTPMEAYESIRIFYRGCRTQTVKHATALGFRSTETAQDSFDDVIVFVRFRQPKDGPRRRFLRGNDKLPGGAQPGSVMVKSFRNIARIELPMLLPDVQIIMSRKDAMLLGGPAVLGGIPIVLNLLPALSVVLVVIGAYLGFSGEVTQDKLMKAVGALSVLIGAGAFMWRQFSNYSYRKLKYQKRVADNIYFKNITNDAGVLETLINAAEDQEVKEVILAYHSLLTAGPAAHAGELDRRIENWVKATFQIDVDFEVGDALSKLEGLGFLTQKDGKIAAVPLPDALARLDTLWDRLYDFTRAPGVHAAA